MDDTPSGLVLFAISFGVLLSFVLFLWAINVLPGMVHAIMSRAPVPPRRDSVPIPVHVPGWPTSTEAQATEVRLSGTDSATPDTNETKGSIDAWEMPRISRRLSDDEVIALLAVQRTPAGKLRFSANQIHTLVGGPRAKVLGRIREIREGPAKFRPLTAEQRATRDALGLPGQ